MSAARWQNEMERIFGKMCMSGDENSDIVVPRKDCVKIYKAIVTRLARDSGKAKSEFDIEFDEDSFKIGEVLLDHLKKSKQDVVLEGNLGYYDLIVKLVHYGAEPSELIDDPEWPTMILTNFCDKAPTCKFELSQIQGLINAGADVTKARLNKEYFHNPESNEELLKFLMEKGLKDNIVDKSNDYHSMIHDAAQAGRFKLVDMLIKNGSDPCKLTKSHEDPLSLALKNRHYMVCKYLMEQQGYSASRRYDALMILGAHAVHDGVINNLPWDGATRFLRKAKKQEIETYTSSVFKDPPRGFQLSEYAQKGLEYLSQAKESTRLSEDDRRGKPTDFACLQALLIAERVFGPKKNKLLIGLLGRLGQYFLNYHKVYEGFNVWLFCLERFVVPEFPDHHDHDYNRVCGRVLYDLTAWIEDLIWNQMGELDPKIFQQFIKIMMKLVASREKIEKPKCLASFTQKVKRDSIHGITERALLAFMTCKIDKTVKLGIIRKFIRLNPMDYFGNNLLNSYIMLPVGRYCIRERNLPRAKSTLVELMSALIKEGILLNQVNLKNCTPMDTFCTSFGNYRWSDYMTNKDIEDIFKLLIDNGSHIDTHPNKDNGYVHERLAQYAKEKKIDIFDHIKLKCLAARAINLYEIKVDTSDCPQDVLEYIKLHPTVDVEYPCGYDVEFTVLKIP